MRKVFNYITATGLSKIFSPHSLVCFQYLPYCARYKETSEVLVTSEVLSTYWVRATFYKCAAPGC